ncbi:Pentatricopeptide repeat-containing protein At2g34400 [Linum grandiflorum]
MLKKDVVAWNAMITGYAQNGESDKTITLFNAMRETSISPNKITMVGVLSACASRGALELGKWIETYALETGLLHEAWEFIEKMPGKPDEIVLGALLAACRKKKNEDVSERVIKLLLEVEPSNSGNYVISSKIYADMRRWEESANVRVLMRERGVTKTPGCSWIELESQVHEFHAVHMYQLLNEQMRKEGYVPKPDSSSR